MSVPTYISYLELKRLKKKKAKEEEEEEEESVWSIVIFSSSFPVSPFPFVAPAIKISGEALEKRIKRIDNSPDVSKNGKKATG